MAHLIETMAYTGQTPWHGLGHSLPANRSVEEWIHAAGMNWNIEDSPVQFKADKHQHLNELRTSSNHKVLYRSDTKAALSVVGKQYKVVQPREILGFYRDLTEQSGFELETAGVLKDGKKLWALARTGQSAELKGRDTINGYLLLATACDGSMATTAQFTSVRVVCNNTLSIATANNSGAVKVPHRSAFNPDTVKQQLGASVSNWDNFSDQMVELSRRKLTDKEAHHYLSRLLNQNALGVSDKTKVRNIGAMMNLYLGNGMGASLPSAANTAFGLLNAVTQYVDHEQRARSQDNRLNSAWFGQGAKFKNRAFENALLLTA